MRVLVTGGRDLNDKAWVWAAIEEIWVRRGPINLLIHGAARTGTDATEAARTGTDATACRWAAKTGTPCAIRHSKRVLALDRPDLLLAFPSLGTARMVRLAREAGVPVETA